MKKLLYILLLTPLFFVSSCEEDVVHGCLDSQAMNYNSGATIDNNSCEYLGIGSLVEGGIVFYINETGEHGLVAALEESIQADVFEDGRAFMWGCYNEEVGSNGTAIGTGYQNTMDIVNHGCEIYEPYWDQGTTITAAQAALNHESEGYSDWYLPSIDELQSMYYTIGNGGSEGNIGGFQNNRYWCSSEYTNNVAWGVDFGNGNAASNHSKSNTYRVRVIRAF